MTVEKFLIDTIVSLIKINWSKVIFKIQTDTVKKKCQSQGYDIHVTYFFKHCKVKIVDAHKLHDANLINWSAVDIYRKKQDPIEGGSLEKKTV